MRGFFFFSSRRRHTRCGRDWSSDVCSSDLDQASGLASAQRLTAVEGARLWYTIGIGACDTNPAGIAYETDDVVVIGGTVDPSTGGPCIDLLKLQPVSVTLTTPLGARVVLDALSGQPLVLGAG